MEQIMLNVETKISTQTTFMQRFSVDNTKLQNKVNLKEPDVYFMRKEIWEGGRLAEVKWHCWSAPMETISIELAKELEAIYRKESIPVIR